MVKEYISQDNKTKGNVMLTQFTHHIINIIIEIKGSSHKRYLNALILNL